jgi:hypothetical protein
MTHLVIDERSEGQKVEQISEESPNVGVPILAETLVVEPIHLRDLPRFVVPTENSDTVAVAKFESDEEGDRLDGIVSAIDVVPHEEVVGVR